MDRRCGVRLRWLRLWHMRLQGQELTERSFTRKGVRQKPDPLKYVVPRDRIELPTRGFSVPCSTN